MADDNLFPEGETTQQAPKEQGNGAEPTQPQPGGVRLTETQVMDGFRQMGEAVQTMAQRIEAMEKAAEEKGNQPAPAEDNQELYQDPSGYIARRVQQGVKEEIERLHPALKTIFSELGTAANRQAKEGFDKDFGEGSWDEFVANDLSVALDKLPAEYRGQSKYVEALAAGVVGGKLRDPDSRSKLLDRMNKARAKPEPPTMLGGQRPAPPPGELTVEERDFVKKLQGEGVQFSEKDYLQARNRPATEEAWGATWMKPEGRGETK